jgi:hypothetical protein
VARSCERAAAASRQPLVAQGRTTADKIDGHTESRRFFLSFVQVSRQNQICLPGNQCQPTRIQWDWCAWERPTSCGWHWASGCRRIGVGEAALTDISRRLLDLRHCAVVRDTTAE